MVTSIVGVVRDGKIELPEQTDLPEGVRVLITVLADSESRFWVQASLTALDKVWANTEDDIYAKLLGK